MPEALQAPCQISEALRRGYGCWATFRERFSLHLGFHSEPFHLTCASAYSRGDSFLPISVSKSFPRPAGFMPSWSVTASSNTVATSRMWLLST